jgi:hypothetical protein
MTIVAVKATYAVIKRSLYKKKRQPDEDGML